jgi:hypothetical protein
METDHLCVQWRTLLLATLNLLIVRHKSHCSFVFIFLGGVRLSPLGTSATNWPTVPAPGWWMMIMMMMMMNVEQSVE